MCNFVYVAASIAELAHGEKSCTQSIAQSLSIFDAPGTEACASEYVNTKYNMLVITTGSFQN